MFILTAYFIAFLLGIFAGEMFYRLIKYYLINKNDKNIPDYAMVDPENLTFNREQRAWKVEDITEDYPVVMIADIKKEAN